MISKELLKKIKLIQIYTDKLTDSVLAGEYHSAFKGRGMEFEEVREYVPGDSVRMIDWNVTARMGHPFIKVHKEERELTIILMVDLSFSGQFGTKDKFKNDVAAELAALFAYLAIKNNDKVGLLLFTEHVEKYIPPKKGKAHIFRVIKDVLTFKPKAKGTKISNALEYLMSVVKKKSVCFLISDFLDRDYDVQLKLAGRKHDLIAVKLEDLRENKIPNLGLFEFIDAETNESIIIDSSDMNFQKILKEESLKREKALNRLFRMSSVDEIKIDTHKSYVDPVMKFFRAREKRA